MVSLTQLVATVAACVIVAVIPGPGVLFVVGRALTWGIRKALVSVLSHAAGDGLQLVAVACGIGVVLQRSVVAFTVLKLAGAACLVFLGVQALRRRHDARAAFVAGHEPARLSTVLRQGVLVGVTNPKSVVFYAAIIPQFVHPAAGHVPAQILTLGAVAVAVFVAVDAVWGLLAGTVRWWLARRPQRVAHLDGAGGLAMITVGISLAVTSRQ